LITTDAFELLVFFAQVVVEVEQLLVGKFLLQPSVGGGFHPMALYSVLQVNLAHLNL